MKRIYIILIILCSFISIYSHIGSLKYKNMNLNYFANKRLIELLNKKPEYKKFISVPSNRDIIDFHKKADMDTINVLVLKIEFEEDTTTLTTGNGKMDLRGSMDREFIVDSTGDTVRNLFYDPPHDSLYFYRHMEALRNYYLDDSHGKLYIDFGIYPKGLYNTYTVPHTMKFYGDTINIVAGMFTLLRDALKQAELSGKIDFEQYDAVIIFHAGSMWQTDLLNDSPFDLPAVYISGADIVFGEPITAGNKTFNDGIIYSETANQDGGYAFIQGGLAHEFGHQLGLLDLYDTSGRTIGMGGWALMGTGNWNMSGLVPPHHGGYNAYTCYNIKPNNNYPAWVYFNQTLEIHNDTSNVKIKYLGANEDSSIKIIKIPINSHEFYLIENRYSYLSPDTISDNPDSNGFRVWKDGVLVKVNDYDISLPLDINTGGLAIYHIDMSIINADSGMNQINAGIIKGVDMEEADMVQDFEMSFYDITDIEKVFFGNKYDVFVRGGVNSTFSPFTYPSTKANNNSNTHIWIYDISPSDTVMSFSVKFDYRLKGFPLDINTDIDVNAPTVLKIRNRDVICFQTMKGEIYMIDSAGNPAFNTTGIVSTFDGDNESYSTPAAGNITNSGSNDIVITSYSGSVHVLKTDSITPMGVFIEANNSPIKFEKGIVSSAVLYDIDNDSLDEILITSEDMYFHILEYDNDSLKEMNFSPIFLGTESWSNPVIVDSTIYVLGSDGIIRAYSFEGLLKCKSNTENVAFTSTSPVIADIDNDNINEIIFIRGDGILFILNAIDLSVEYMKDLEEYSFYSSPIVGDINGDNKMEIVLFVYDKLYVLDNKLNIINNYPVEIQKEQFVQSTPILVDINDDNIQDILYQTPGGQLKVISNNVSPGFPLMTGQYSNSTPCFYDINKNGKMDIIALSDNQLFVYEINSNDSKYNWAFYHYNTSNNRFFPYTFQNDSNYTDNIIINNKNNYIYPNPVYDIFTLRFEISRDADYNIKIFDIAGTLRKTLINKTATQGINEIQIDVSDLGAGFYILLLSLNDDMEKSENKKFKFVVRQ